MWSSPGSHRGNSIGGHWFLSQEINTTGRKTTVEVFLKNWRKAALHSPRTAVSRKVLMGLTFFFALLTIVEYVKFYRICEVNFYSPITYSVSSALLSFWHSIDTALSWLNPAGKQPSCQPASLRFNITDSRILNICIYFQKKKENSLCWWIKCKVYRVGH